MRLIRRKPKNQQEKIEERRAMMLKDDAPFAIKEAYKAARTNLMFMFAEKDRRCVSITSAFPGEGKTTTCANMAITFAQTGAKTIIIDADLRKPSMHRMFAVQASPGLSDVLGGFAKKEDVIVPTEYENLYLIPAGTIPPNPAELLSSQGIDDLLRFLTEEQGFEYVFVDTPPINVVTDAAVVSRNLVGTVVVVRSGATGNESLKDAVLALEQAGVKVLGFILHNINVERYSYKYSKYGKYGSKKGNYYYNYRAAYYRYEEDEDDESGSKKHKHSND